MEMLNNRVSKLIAMNKARAKHNRSNSRVKGYADRTYGIWQAFRDRCNNPNRKDYNRYGGRGITYDPAWDNFQQFVLDMGNAPNGLTLDRIDNDKGYYKENCRWATRRQQSYNSTRIRHININGVAKPLQEWLKLYNISKSRFYQRLDAGWTEVDALTTPLKKRREYE